MKDQYTDLVDEEDRFHIFKDEILDTKRKELEEIFGIDIDSFNYEGIKVYDSVAATSIVKYKFLVFLKIAESLNKKGDNKIWKILNDSQKKYQDIGLRIQYITNFIQPSSIILYI